MISLYKIYFTFNILEYTLHLIYPMPNMLLFMDGNIG